MKTALLTMLAQQNLLTSTISQGESELSHVSLDRQELKSNGMDHLSQQGASLHKIESQRELLEQGVAHIDSQHRLLEQGVAYSSQHQTLATEQQKAQMGASYKAFITHQNEYATSRL